MSKRQLADLPPPWNKFRLEKEFHAEWIDENGRLAAEHIREIIYSKFTDQPSITRGSMNPFISPMFWSAIQGTPRDEIYDPGTPTKPISEAKYKRYFKLFDMWKMIVKVIIIHPIRYEEKLIDTHKEFDYTLDQCELDLAYRLKGLQILENSLESDSWPKLLLLVPPASHPRPDKRSFTITPQLSVSVTPNPGTEPGQLDYWPTPPLTTQSAYMTCWGEECREILQSRGAAPELAMPEAIPLKQNACKLFNIGSVKILRETLEKQQTQLTARKQSANVHDIGTSIFVPNHLTQAANENHGKHVFISYSGKDKKLRDRLETHLAELKKSGLIKTWHDQNMLPGSKWREQITKEMARCSVVLLLVSPDFLDSKYCQAEQELALKRAAHNNAVVIPVLLKPCDWKATSLGQLSVLPDNRKPITEWNNRDSAFENITLRLRQMIT